MNTLPEELLAQIVGFIPAGDYKTLTALCLVSRKFSRIAHPQLYAHVKLPKTSRKKSIVRLFQLLCTDPEVAGHVKRLTVVDEHPELLQASASATIRLQHSALCQKLHKLYNLRRIDYDLGESTFTDIVGFFRLPNLESLDLRYGQADFALVDPDSHLGERTRAKWDFVNPSIKHLGLAYIDYRRLDVLSCVASTCVSLESLSLVMDARRCRRAGTTADFGCHGFQRFICYFAHAFRYSLRHLELREDRPPCGRSFFRTGDDAALRIYRIAACLEEVKIEFSALLRANHSHAPSFIPSLFTSPSLRKLHIKCMGLRGQTREALRQALKQFYVDIATRQPCLKEVTVELVELADIPGIREAVLASGDRFRLRFQPSFAKRGVRFNVVCSMR